MCLPTLECFLCGGFYFCSTERSENLTDLLYYNIVRINNFTFGPQALTVVRHVSKVVVKAAVQQMAIEIFRSVHVVVVFELGRVPQGNTSF